MPFSPIFLGAVEIAKALPTNTSLHTLELGSSLTCFRRNHIESRAAAKLAVSLCRNKTLTYLGLKGNEVGRKGK